MPDNFGRMTSDEAPQSLKDSCFPKSKTCRICGETSINTAIVKNIKTADGSLYEDNM
ncbi:MAG: hypothetical protein BWY04_01084 [candidate division CPR1 bacterium ADurb.Bin160]|uniref:Uncharacterized protein n=1 Tax=candidate division CPR1 bacterium ADurb.Bin160 TaxID=1852826 RepID=A0A1V5ZMA0_9BACT|nr:MAG: hypothetical protein BWY04_01084 [candidate division CPR1 bacterium ADurb.Bin160]